MFSNQLKFAFAVGLFFYTSTSAGAETQLNQEFSKWAEFVVWIFEQQRAFHRELVEAIQSLKNDDSLTPAFALVTASFFYGVFHAAGPGHGKAIIATYLATQPENRARAIKLSALASFCQGLTAIGMVYGIIYVVGLLPGDATKAIIWSERASFALVSLLGIFLIMRAVSSWIKRYDNAAPIECSHHIGSSHYGTNHIRGFQQTAAVILSIGLRPCSGAVIVLVFAHTSGLVFSGVLSVLAMSAGTGLAVSGLAISVVSVRIWILKRVNWPSSGGALISFLMGLAGGFILIVIGVTLLQYTFTPPHPMRL